jgi:hypothetical protein
MAPKTAQKSPLETKIEIAKGPVRGSPVGRRRDPSDAQLRSDLASMNELSHLLRQLELLYEAGVLSADVFSKEMLQAIAKPT